MDYLPATKLIDSSLKILDEPVATDAYSVIVDKGNIELLDVINEVILELKEKGEIDKYLLKHLGE